jgi:uncharacterized protein (DUF697 family)
VPATPPWNVCKEALQRAQSGEFDHASENVKAAVVSEVIRSCSSSVAVFALQPFTGVDSAIITPIHYRMVGVIARIYGCATDTRAAYREILRALRGRIITHHLAMMGAKFVPFTNLLAVPVAYALTCAIGEVSAEYYRRGRAIEKREMKARFDATYMKAHEHAFREKRNELRAMFRAPEIQKQVRELKKARSDGTLGPEEVERRIDEILRQDELRTQQPRQAEGEPAAASRSRYR